MDTTTEDSLSHLYDGVDRDNPHNRHRRSFRFPEALDDLQELRAMEPKQ